MKRINVDTLGWLIAQMHDDNDPLGVAYDTKGRAQLLLGGARYTWSTGTGGLPILKQVSGTAGPVSGLFPWPGKSPRTLAQLSWVFPAKITTASPLKATPVETGSGSGWTVATDLDEVEVYTSDGTAPSVGTFGIVVVGTELDDQKPLFFQGGGAGSATVYKITVNPGDGSYSGIPYDVPNGTALGPEISTLFELNASPNVPLNEWVQATLRPDGYSYFNLPVGSCS